MYLAVLSTFYIIFLYFLFNPRQDFLFDKDWWGMACVFFCYAMTSGQLWNTIRNPPIFSIKLLNRMNAQSVLESCIVTVTYIAIFRSIIRLMEAVNERNITVRNNNVTGAITKIFMLYGVLFLFFRKKAGDDFLNFIF
ncbi:hypothetical protein L9F63_001798 [Diploptera punctata]|uniref:Uncharacterized protein n=1 Tax=Diploptera punctata TaxID=6984 RepID=A0AAD8A568_DIPPU|nr:hypothetical protein L9F63_001798 [Diploptera punctata]